MAAILVGYDLKSGQDYKPLIAKLKSYPNWWHWLDSTWIIKVNKGVVELRDELLHFTYVGDRLLVVEVTGDHWASYITEEANSWLDAALART